MKRAPNKRHGRTCVAIDPLAVECPWCFAVPGRPCTVESGKPLDDYATGNGEPLAHRVHVVRDGAARRSLSAARKAG